MVSMATKTKFKSKGVSTNSRIGCTLNNNNILAATYHRLLKCIPNKISYFVVNKTNYYICIHYVSNDINKNVEK